MQEQFARSEMLLGSGNMERLRSARVAVFGVGGVGGYVTEALARGGVGMLDLIDNDTVCLSNLNRQIIALHSTIGQYKVDAARARILDINPEAVVHTYRIFYLPETADQFDFTQYDYVVDAIDTVSGKLMLIEQAKRAGVPVISSMGAGNKLDPTAFRVADISETSVCPLAKVMRRELKKRGITDVKVVYSEEKPLIPRASGIRPEESCAAGCAGNSAKSDQTDTETAGNLLQSGYVGTEMVGSLPESGQSDMESVESPAAAPRRQTPGSVSFVPSVVGLIIAGEVIKDLCGLAG